MTENAGRPRAPGLRRGIDPPHMPSDAQIKMGSRANSMSHSSLNYTPCCTFCSAIGQLGATAFDIRVAVGNCGQVSNTASTARHPINGAREPAGQSGCLLTGGRRSSLARTRALEGENKHSGHLAVLVAPPTTTRCCAVAILLPRERTTRLHVGQDGEQWFLSETPLQACRMHGRRLDWLTRKIR